ncbi:MAG: hypothetical protein U0V48_05305 [Anaerolineales bacterium]
MSEAAEKAVEQLSVNGDQSLITDKPITGYLRGLFSGGTLAFEMMVGLQARFLRYTPILQSLFLSRIWMTLLHSKAHTIIDLGDEFFMVGRLHPMIDNDLRIRRMKQEAADADVGMILFDVVLGEGSHLDPARSWRL